MKYHTITIKEDVYLDILKLTTPKKKTYTAGKISFSTAIQKLYRDAMEYRKIMENVV